MNIYIIEKENNMDIYNYLTLKSYLVQDNVQCLNKCNVVIVSRVQKVKEALDIIDISLQNGAEVVCIKPNYNDFVCRLLIRDGAIFV